MSREVVATQEPSFIRRGLEALVRPAKILGITALSGAAGYATARGIDAFVIPVEPLEVFEVAVTGASALMGMFVATETIDN
jgi:hypothetical protein